MYRWLILFILLKLCFLNADPIIFTKQDSADWTLPENQDRIADSVWITRKHTQSIFNIAQESGYSGSSGSPVGTQWVRTSTLSAQTSDYTNFVAMHGGNPQSLINDTISLYLPDYELYFDVVFLSFTGGNNGGGFSYSREQVETMGVNIDLPKEFSLYNAYPNPFNPTTTIHYELPENANVNITVYDIMGKIVNNLVSNQQSAGYRSISWNATNDLGQPVSAGMYIYTIQAGTFRQTRKMLLMK